MQKGGENVAVEIKNKQIMLTVPIQGEAEPEQYVVEKGKLIDSRLFGIPYRDGGALPAIIGQLRVQSVGLDNGKRKFAESLADNLNAAIVAIQNSAEF